MTNPIDSDLTDHQTHFLAETYYHYRAQIGAYLGTHHLEYPNPPPFVLPDPLPSTHPDDGTIMREYDPDWRKARRESEALAKLERWQTAITPKHQLSLKWVLWKATTRTLNILQKKPPMCSSRQSACSRRTTSAAMSLTLPSSA